jgi:hypothetical protein
MHHSSLTRLIATKTNDLERKMHYTSALQKFLTLTSDIRRQQAERQAERKPGSVFAKGQGQS